MTPTTTLNRIRDYDPCPTGWTRLLCHLGKTQADDEPLAFSTILDSNGLADALWCCRVESDFNLLWLEYALWAARRVLPIIGGDPKAEELLHLAEEYANGRIQIRTLTAARGAARPILSKGPEHAAWKTVRWASLHNPGEELWAVFTWSSTAAVDWKLASTGTARDGFLLAEEELQAHTTFFRSLIE